MVEQLERKPQHPQHCILCQYKWNRQKMQKMYDKRWMEQVYSAVKFYHCNCHGRLFK
jgi:hypothetical protein